MIHCLEDVENNLNIHYGRMTFTCSYKYSLCKLEAMRVMHVNAFELTIMTLSGPLGGQSTWGF